MSSPDWVQDSVFYQIFPDRFANGDPSNDPINVQEWGSQPTKWGFQGGDLRGILDNLDYLIDLQVNAIYLNPIFRSTSNHRYNTTDYFEIDPRLGDLGDFQELIQECHRRGIRVVLDGVFNHTGRGFFAFNDVLEKGEDSEYCDWYHLNHFPVRAYGRGKAGDFKAWWGIRSLPKLNIGTEEVREFIFRVVRHWMQQGIDGWRLDVPNEIDSDPFWAEFRRVVERVNPDAYLLGEIWTMSHRWVGPEHFDGVMHYPLRKAVLGFLSSRAPDPELLARSMETIYNFYPPEYRNLQYLPLSSHDTRRVWTVLNGDLELVKSAFSLIMTYPGAPAVYYGDEIGLPGGKDPDSRRAFPWDRSAWNHELREHVARLIELRRSSSALRRGTFRSVGHDKHAGWVAFERSLGDETWLIAISTAEQRQRVEIPSQDIPAVPGALHFPLEGRTERLGGSIEIMLDPMDVRIARLGDPA